MIIQTAIIGEKYIAYYENNTVYHKKGEAL